jgi:hypothetical protein
MASLSALLILAVRALSMEPRPTRIQHVHPASTIQPRSKLARAFSLRAQRAAGARPRSVCTRVPIDSPNDSGVWRSAARGCGFPDDSGIEEEWAGGGPGQEGRVGADPGRRRLSGGRAEPSLIGWRRRHSVCGRRMCDIHMCMDRCDRAEVVLTLLRSIIAKMPLNRKIWMTGIKGSAAEVAVSGFEPTLCVAASTRFPDLTAYSSGN